MKKPRKPKPFKLGPIKIHAGSDRRNLLKLAAWCFRARIWQIDREHLLDAKKAGR